MLSNRTRPAYRPGAADDVSLSDAWVIAGPSVGRADAVPLASLAMQAAGRVGGEVVQEVRASSGSIRDHGRDGAVRYSRARRSIVTGSAIKSMLAPASIPIGFAIVVGIINARMLGGLLIGTIVTGVSS